MRSGQYILIFTLLIFSAHNLYSQFQGRPYVINHNPDQFRMDNQNWSVSTDDQGITYIGNNRGLITFDGSNWDFYQMPEGMVVRSVYAAGDSLVYVGSYEEFGYWKRDESGRMTYHSLSDTLDMSYFHNDEIWRIVPHQEKIYFQSFSNIYVYDGQDIETFNPDDNLVLLMKARDRLFIHMVGRGLCEIENGKFQLIPGSEKFAQDEIKAIMPYGEDRFLVGASAGGLYIYDGKTFEKWDLPAADKISEAEVNAGLSFGKLKVIGTLLDGIFILQENGRLKEHLHTGNFLSNNTILSLSKTSDGNLWAGLDRGLDYISLDNVLDFYIHPSRSIGTAYDALLDGQTLYLGTNQGLFKYDFKQGEGFTNPRLINGTQGQVWYLEKIRGEILCGHNNGTFRITDSGPKTISMLNGGYDFLPISRHGEDYLLQSTYSIMGLYKYGPEGWKFLRSLDGFLEPISNIEKDHVGNIWGNHAQKGLFKLGLNPVLDSVDQTIYYGKDRGLPKERYIRMGKIDNRIIFTTGSGLYTYDDLNDSIIPYQRLKGKLKGFWQSRHMFRARNEHYWFIRNGEVALYQISGKQVNRRFFYDFSRLNLYLSSRHPRIRQLTDSLHLICLDKGFAVLDENRTRKKQKPVEVSIRRVAAFSKSKQRQLLSLTSTQKPVEIDYNRRSLSFTFSCKNHSLYPEYRYKLRGMNNKWSNWSSNSSVQFTRLPAGKYTFMVQATNPQGQISTPLSYTFTINPPWYASTTAWIIYSAMVILLGLVARKLFRRRLQKHKAEIEQQEKTKRKREKMLQEQKYMKLQNEKLQAEISHKSYQLANYTMTILRKNEHLTHLKEEIQKQKKELGPRYPNYYYRKLLQLIDRGISSEEDWKQFEMHFDQAHENFLKRLKSQYPDLTQGDLKLCAYLRLNLTSKEIAPLLNISTRSLEVRRYRLRKRLNLDTEENLVEFLLNF
jgi:DNA-binding CsgD family transcriptional regulator